MAAKKARGIDGRHFPRLVLRSSQSVAGCSAWIGLALFLVARTVHPGPSAYCCLVSLPDGSIGLLYEGGEKDRYARINFARFGKDVDMQESVA